MTPLRFDHVVFADDFFRSAVNGLAYHDANRKFLRGLFETSLQRLGITARDEAAVSHGGAVDVARLMARLRLPCTSAGWASACTADLTPLAGQDGLPAFGPGCLVIGWGLTPALQGCIDRSGASYIDIEIDPVRFTSHLHLCARTNDPVIAAALRACTVDEEDFWNHAAAIKGYFARRGASSVFDERLRVGVFFGQSLVDLSLVSGGRTMHPASVIAPLKKLADSVDLLIVKPHPYEPALHHLAPIARAIPNVAWTRENSYALLSAANVEFVCGMSSGVLTEARYFMKVAHPLIRSDRNARDRLPSNCSDWMSVGPEIAAMNFMATVCGADHAPHAAHWPSTTLDRAFATRWGFDDQSPGLAALPVAAIGRSHVFHQGSAATAWLSHGWTEPEPWGVWTEGEHACLVIPLPAPLDWSVEAGARAFDVHIEGSRYLGATEAPSVLAVVNGTVVPAQRSAYLPLDALEFVLQVVPQGAPGRQVLVIQFAIGDPERPCDACGSGDSRRLGFGLKSLKVSLPRAPRLPVSARESQKAPSWMSSVFRTRV
ncbi:hypothetical protein H7F36_08140 [Variovorax sp. PAMC28562]|uniref:hypothetical protein n=1 Tax=Variovorax sp. PAMC28562 TaxID=2762323 RepID=UPI00164DDEC1|nr:hypothetical protein [Variovorax sp. PAMC28562]QNK75155.1 hypothetical protein H7F36_08140 [Variovorax sp. PAMC28562]